MADTLEEGHDELVTLLWELKAAWQARSGEEILLTNLLVEREALDRFLDQAAKLEDPMIRGILARILALRSSLDRRGIRPGKGTAPPLSIPSGAERAGSRGSKFDTLRGGAALVASVLVSFAAARYLMVAEASAPTIPATAGAIAVGSEAVVPPSSPPVAERAALSASPAVAAVAGAEATTPAAADAGPTFRIHGSNTVGEELSPALVEAYLKSKGGDEVRTVTGASHVEKRVLALLPGRPAPVAVEIHAHGSGTAFTDLAGETTDLGQSSRRIKPDEVTQLAARYGDLSKPGGEHVIALDGLAIIVHPQNAVSSLSIDQVASLFAGKLTNWSQVGGTAGPVSLYARDDVSGTWDTFKHLVLAPGGVQLVPAARRFESSSDLSDAVAADPNAIGFIGLPYVRSAKLLAISAEKGGLALLPTPFTVGTEDYPLSRRLYFYAPAASDNGMMKEFVDFALSEPGQEVVRQIGFVSQNLALEKPRIVSNAPARYRDAALEGERLSLNFRFETGSEDLDAKSLRDLDRVVTWFDRDRSREILLFGFTDDRGEDRVNVSLSKKRAEVVAKALESRGLYPREIEGFGESLPVASNGSEEGRNRNRRVEVWVR